MKRLLVVPLLLVATLAVAQFPPIPTGKATLRELDMKTWPADSSAKAVILDEIGQAYINMDDNRLIFQYYARIKILTKDGLAEADIDIPLYKSDINREELLSNVWAASYTIQNGSMKKVVFDPKELYTENYKYQNRKKFAIPNVQVGSVIEVSYTIESPFFFSFRSWEFQDDIPKAHSQYTVQIPGNYQYAITMRGALKLDRNESSIKKECFSFGGSTADCVVNTYGMTNIPAFKEEDYMTSKNNFLSAIYFELGETQDFDGVVHKYTRAWKDVDDELRGHEDFGKQIRKAASIWSDDVRKIVAGEADGVKRAKAIYELIRTSYTWNEAEGKYTDVGVRKIYEVRKGNVADINLSLVGALQEAGLNASPMILSTREHGLVTDIHPVMSEFDYVVAAVAVGTQQFLLDATDDFLPFGLLPTRCLNDKGRVVSKEPSWVTLTPKEKFKTVTVVDLTLKSDGVFSGKITITYSGYAAVRERHEIAAAKSNDQFIKDHASRWSGAQVSDFSIENTDDPDKPLIEKMNILIEGAGGSGTIYLNPVMIRWIEKNPFTSKERSYPVDYGAPTENVVTMTIALPENTVIDELPKNALLGLPQGGGRYVFSVTPINNKLSIVNGLYLNRPVYTSVEYHYLKELYARILQIQQSQIVLKGKP